MKKVTDFLKPNILIILGALIFLYFMNWLSYQGGGLAIGIIAVICAAYYLAIGILSIVIGNKFSPMVKKVFDVISIDLFAVFMFVYFLIFTIEGAKIDGYMGPTAWIIAILSMIAALALAVIYALARFLNKGVLLRFAYLFSAIFALVLLLNLLFANSGDAKNLGQIDVILTVIDIAFVFYLFNSLGSAESIPAPAKKEEQPKEEAPAQEEQSQEEVSTEEPASEEKPE